ncbi:MAG: hypothetical protein JNK23_17480 [Opitutaceae bacterium]|nr:hypothetical protein [Opitutaceae bacterium]
MSRAERILVFGLCAVVGAFYCWTVWSTGEDWRRDDNRRDYYNRLIDGWLDGQLHMKTEVPAELLALKNPYDPAERRPGLGLHDASFYRGKYYLYFGVAPALTLMLPYRIVTGTDMPLQAAILVFVFGGFLASVALFCAVRRRYFPESGRLVLAIGVLTLGCCGAWLVLLRRPEMWELPIGGGYCFAMLALLALWRSLHAAEGRGRLRWLAATALLLGLAIGSRPTYLLTLPLLAAPMLWWWRREKRLPRRELAAAIAPLAIVGAAMAWHNWARFDNPLEFGQAYQFSLDYESKLPHFAARYVPYNLQAHFLSAAEWQRYFPFIKPGNPGPAPAGYTIHRGDIYGVLANYPLAWLAFLAPLALWRRNPEERGPLGTWLAAVALLFGTVGLVMVSFFSSLSRYQVDFMPAFMVLAVVGLLALERWLPARARMLAGAAAGLAAAFGVVFGVLFSLQFDGLLREHSPAIERRVALLLNHVPALIERGLGVKHGPIELTLKWAAHPPAGDETLVTIGRAPREDRLVARHSGDGRVRLGFIPADAAERFSEHLVLVPGQPHRVTASIVSLLPPATHPYFSGRTREEIRALLRRAEITWDGASVLREHLRLDRAGAGLVRVGRAESWRRIAEAGSALPGEPALAGAGDTLRLRVRLRAQPAGTREPLVVTGRSGAGEMMILEHRGGGEVRFVLDSWGQPMRASRPVRIDFATEHTLEITLGALATVDDATEVRGAHAGPVRVALDGAVVWEERSDYHVAEHAEVYVGRNPIGGTSCGLAFSGEILSAERVRRE